MTRPKLVKVTAGHYTFGPFTLRGIAVRGDGRGGSRINCWLVYRDGELIEQYHTLEVATNYLTRRLYRGDGEARSHA